MKLFAVLPTVLVALGLTPALDANAQRSQPQPIESPIVHPDRTVTFNFRAVGAKKVELSAQFIRDNQALTADSNGVWTITLGPVAPNLYPYNFILDNLIAQKKAVPMIVVMPYGNMMMGTPPPTSVQAAEMYKVFTDELVGNIMPYVEANYRVIPDRTKRAIAGFSRGGGQSLFAGFSNLDKFAWIGSYSAYLTPEVFNKYFSKLAETPEATNRQLKLLWLGVGSEDFLYKQAVTFDEFLKEEKIEHKSLVTDGGHTWMNARHYLTETLQLYFK
jgi:Putative esterase